MGTPIGDLFQKHEISMDDLSGKILAIDTYNMLYQFLTTIRMHDGKPLTDSKGNITSHLQGLFSRTSAFLSKGIKPVFVFDGKSPELKDKERERRKLIKQKAQALHTQAELQGDVGAMKKYASRTARLTPDMVNEARALVAALGLPLVNAPSEGEAQAAHMVLVGHAYAVVSQDMDALLFGAPRVIRNLSVSGKRKKPGTLQYAPVTPELVSLKDNLLTLNLSQRQLICLGILVGTDYNYGGIKGIGPKKALALIHKHKENTAALFEEAEWVKCFETPWQEILALFENIPTTDEYTLSWKKPDEKALISLLCNQHDFSKERILSSIEDLQKSSASKQQKALGDFF